MDTDALVDVYRSIESELGWRVTGNKEMTRKDGSYIMIPFNPKIFYERLQLVKAILNKMDPDHQWRSPKFVDVGAGLGFKLKIADSIGFDAEGIEFDRKYVTFARRYLDIHLLHRNALDVDYGKYDVIYYYRPIANETTMEKLEARILKTMKNDAIVMATYATGNFPYKVDEIGDEIYVKKGQKSRFKRAL